MVILFPHSLVLRLCSSIVLYFVLFCFFRFHYVLTYALVTDFAFLNDFCFMGFVCGSLGVFCQFHFFSSILYLLLDFGVSFKAFVTCLCLY